MVILAWTELSRTRVLDLDEPLASPVAKRSVHIIPRLNGISNIPQVHRWIRVPPNSRSVRGWMRVLGKARGYYREYPRITGC